VTTGPGTLYVIATPIGNMDDISVRARNLLGSVDLVAAEDTRRAGQLLTRLGIRNSLLSLHEHNESQRIDGLLADLAEGRSLALISELSVAGLASDRFRFEGFLPARAGPRSTRLEALSQCADTMIFYESVHRIKATLAAMEKAFGDDRPATLARELTKLHETLYRGTLSDVRQQLDADPGGEKGELTLIVAGISEPIGPERQELERVLGVLLAELSHKQASALAARITGVSRREAYEVARLLREAS